MVSASNAQPASSSITMEFAAKSIPTVKYSIVMLAFANYATMASMLMPMVHVKPGKILTQLSMDVQNGKTTFVQPVPPNTISMLMESASQSATNAENGTPLMDSVLLAISATSSITVLAFLILTNHCPLMLPVIPTAKSGTVESVKLVLTELSSTLMEFAKMLTLCVLLGTMLMVFASAVTLDII